MYYSPHFDRILSLYSPKRRKIYSPDFSCCVYRAPCLGHRFFNAACHAQAFSSSYFSRTVKGTVTRDGEGGSIYFSPNCSKRKNHMISTLKEQFLPHISRSHWKGPEDFFAKGEKRSYLNTQPYVIGLAYSVKR